MYKDGNEPKYEKNEPVKPRQLLIVFMIFMLVTINYADRGVIGVVGPKLRESMHLTIIQFGTVASAFGWGYVPFVFLSGPIVRLIGRRRALYLFVFAWSVFVAGAAVAWNDTSLVLARVLFGAAEGAIFPIGSQLIADYVSRSKRGIASAAMTIGIPCGALAITPVGIWLNIAYGWRSPFIFLGLVGIVWILFWWIVSSYVENVSMNSNVGTKFPSIAQENVVNADGLRSVPSKSLFLNRNLWISGFAFFASAYQLYFMLAFFPTYLVHEKHLPLHSVARFGEIPFLGMFFGALISGFVSDFIRRKTDSLYYARSLFAGISLIIAGILIGLLLLTRSTEISLILIGLAGFANFLANPMFFSIPIDIMPEKAALAASLTTGLGSTAGIVAPLLTGILVQTSGSFSSAFLVVMVLPIIFGLAMIIFVDLDEKSGAPTKVMP
jgi:MFS family permease